MIILKDKLALKKHLKSPCLKNSSIGFVPTMGYLHEGHISIIQRAQSDNDLVIVSLFVNPTQFNNTLDLERYPRDIEGDLEKIKKTSPDAIVFIPKVDDVYKDGVVSEYFDFGGIDKMMEGKFRKDHFEGVATIIKFFFKLINPHRAYFGEKDFQQLRIVQLLVELLKLEIKVISCPIYRESHGLAMSSRNRLLSKKNRLRSGVIYDILQCAYKISKKRSISEIKQWVQKELEKQKFIEIEYVEIVYEKDLKPVQDGCRAHPHRIFLAVVIDQVRLIDNIPLH